MKKYYRIVKRENSDFCKIQKRKRFLFWTFWMCVGQHDSCGEWSPLFFADVNDALAWLEKSRKDDEIASKPWLPVDLERMPMTPDELDAAPEKCPVCEKYADRFGPCGACSEEGKALVKSISEGKEDLPAEAEEFYVPANLGDCFEELKKLMLIEDLKKIKEMDERDMLLHHHGFGTSLRNRWELWGESRLVKWFNSRNIWHADDMSGIILISFWRHMHKEPILLDEQVEHYVEFWRRQGREGKECLK